MNTKTFIVTGALAFVLLHNTVENYVGCINFNEGIKIENLYLHPDTVENGFTILPPTNCKIDWEISGSTGSNISGYISTTA